jgi:hypothetical protein
LFSDLASENNELLAKLASVLKNEFTPLGHAKKTTWRVHSKENV